MHLILMEPLGHHYESPNPSLRWERINIFNLGVDFASKDQRVEGHPGVLYQVG